MIAQSRKNRAAFNGLPSQHGLYLLGCVCLIFGVALIARISSHGWLLQSREEERAMAAFEISRIGTIVVNGPGSRCQRFSYDNDTGATIPDLRPCDETIRFDDREDPGAVRQLDALSRSFLSK
jgi:hypothetical protein